jgi:4-amino-4-deoxy-L-arabinose transferase-like glycosyltransferase
VPLAGAAVALFATCRLGALLYGETAGLVGGVALATMLGFALESRTLRPDMLLSAAVVVALACWQRAERARRGAAAGSSRSTSRSASACSRRASCPSSSPACRSAS